MNRNSNPVELIIFDLDGTLIHSAPDIVITTNELMRRRGRQQLEDHIVTTAIGEGLMPLIYSCFPEARGDSDQLDAIAKEFASVYEENLMNTTTIYAGITELLEALSTGDAKSRTQIAIVTNKKMSWTETTLAGLKLDRFPWVRVFGADSLPERKPHAMPLLEVMKAAQVKPENTVMIGDGLPDIGAAENAGVHSIACGYGYCSVEKLKAAGASLVADTPYHLPKALDAVAGLIPKPVRRVKT
jgi:phosphoglycolate phosphatase